MAAKLTKKAVASADSKAKNPSAVKATAKSAKVTKASKPTKITAPKKIEKESEVEVEVEEEDEENDDDFAAFPSSDESDSDEIDGFESTDDEDNDTTKDLKSSKPQKTSNDITEKEIKDKIDQALSEKKQTKESKEKSGVLYIGRIPHGFYEEQMKAYFSQFGTVSRLRLSRNKKTGKPKHFAFIEFESSEVARIVSETMDNYLLFGHILKVKLVPQENVHDELFAGSNRTFKAIPWTRISKHRNDQKKSQETWDKLQDRENKRRDQKAKKLADLGIDYKYESASPSKVVKSKPKPKATKKRSKA